MTKKALPAGVWRDNNEAAFNWCPDNNEHDHCLGSRCAACREYRRPDNTSVQQDGTQPPPDGYYCGKACKP